MIKKSLDQAINYSPDFKLKKLNHYDNTVKNADRVLFEKCDIQNLYSRKTVDKSRADEYANLGSSMGQGHRAVLYTAFPKKASPKKQSEKDKPILIENDFRQTEGEWNHFDSNINN